MIADNAARLYNLPQATPYPPRHSADILGTSCEKEVSPGRHGVAWGVYGAGGG